MTELEHLKIALGYAVHKLTVISRTTNSMVGIDNSDWCSMETKILKNTLIDAAEAEYPEYYLDLVGNTMKELNGNR